MINVISNMPLTDAQKQKIERAWTKKYNGVVQDYEYSIDPKILGGVLIIDNGLYYDATVKNTLLQIKEALK